MKEREYFLSQCLNAMKEMWSDSFQIASKDTRTVLSISRKYQVNRGVRRQGAEIFTRVSSSEDTSCVVGRRHVCHAPDLSRRAAGAYEAPDTSDNNLSRSDSAGTTSPPRIADPARYVIGCCSCCFSPVGPSFFPSSFRSPRTPFLLADVPPACDTALSLHPALRSEITS